MTLVNSLMYTAPVNDKSDINRRQRVWSKFLDSLDIDYLKNRKTIEPHKQTINDVTSMVKGLKMSIPIFNPKKKKDDQ